MLTPGCSSHIKNLCFVFSLLSSFSLDSSFWHGSTFGDLSGGRACVCRGPRQAARHLRRRPPAPGRRSALPALGAGPPQALGHARGLRRAPVRRLCHFRLGPSPSAGLPLAHRLCLAGRLRGRWAGSPDCANTAATGHSWLSGNLSMASPS